MNRHAETRLYSEHTIAIVIPVYRGEATLEAVVDELAGLAQEMLTPAGRPFRIAQVVLVHDRGPDRSDVVIRRLAARYSFVQPVWLARNYGQHAATLAGMASTASDWVVTMDEDGQHNPSAIGSFLDVALDEQAPLVYAKPTNAAPHGVFRRVTSAVTHRIARRVGGPGLGDFHSYRLVLGEIARGLAAYGGESVYLDVALTWVTNRTAVCPVAMRDEGGRPSSYSVRRLASHFWRLVLTAGTGPLRLVATFGAVLATAAVVLLCWVVAARLASEIAVPGWTSVMVVVLITSGGTLFSLGIIAEYLGIAVGSAMGKPLYLVVTDPGEGPLGRTAAVRRESETGSPAELPRA
jgi:undecaprenyl-phosphate 4-deoxy-4-formamido-L-arabinose transferase